MKPKCGLYVVTKIGGYHGMITAELKRFGKTQYEITYPKDNDHAVIWLHRQEFDIRTDKNKIGF